MNSFSVKLVALFFLGAFIGGAYYWAHARGEAEGYGECRAEYEPMLVARDRKIEEYMAEAEARKQAVLAAQRAKEAVEMIFKRQMQEQTDAYTARLQQLEAGNAGARRELVRLRDALATARVSTDSLLKPINPASRPASDGATSVAETVIRECAERRVEMGGLAARLAEQVIGLQAYARLAQQACSR